MTVLEKMRRLHGYDKGDVARKAGLTLAYYDGVETGSNYVDDIATQRRICRMLDSSPIYMFHSDGKAREVGA